MKTSVTEKGVWIPAELLEGAREVDIRKQDGALLIVPVVESSDETTSPEPDPILNLGTQPVTTDVTDASLHHDRYLTP